jgi:hypothetical protein
MKTAETMFLVFHNCMCFLLLIRYLAYKNRGLLNFFKVIAILIIQGYG